MDSVLLRFRRFGGGAWVATASRRPVKGACRVPGGRGGREGPRIAERQPQQPARLFCKGES